MTSPSPIRAAVIMAGGSGERFWPLSRCDRPKQLLNLTHPDRCMLEESVRLLAPLIPPERIFIVTSQDLVRPIRQGGAGIPPENVMGEPARRNTSGAVAFAAARMINRLGGDPSSILMAVGTADHRIGDAEEYRATLASAIEAAEREPVLATLGIQPTRPETGYGYIEIPEGAMALDGSSPQRPIYRVEGFREKPSRELAGEFLASGRCFWNSGMFFWRISSFLHEADAACPELARAVREMADADKAGDEKRLNEIFLGLEDTPIDIALLERARRVVMAPARYPWDDVGAWDSLPRMLERDERGNVAVGEPLLLDASDCLVYNQAGADKMAVAAIGVSDLVVVVTEDAVLVVPKDRVQEVRLAARELKKRRAKQV